MDADGTNWRLIALLNNTDTLKVWQYYWRDVCGIAQAPDLHFQLIFSHGVSTNGVSSHRPNLKRRKAVWPTKVCVVLTE